MSEEKVAGAPRSETPPPAPPPPTPTPPPPAPPKAKTPEPPAPAPPEPKPPADVSTASEEALARAEAILAAAAEKEARLDALTTAIERREKGRVDADRKAHLLRMGLRTDVLTAEDALVLSPDVDVSTPEGRAKLEQYRDDNPGKFRQVEGFVVPTPEQAKESVKSSVNGSFGADLYLKNLKANIKAASNG